MAYIIEVEQGILNCYERVGDSHYTFSLLPFDCKTSPLTFVFDWRKMALEACEAYNQTVMLFGNIKQVKSVDSAEYGYI